MGLVVGTNCGFVATAPVDDPASASIASIDTRAKAIIDTSPATADKITKLGWYCGNATEAANFEIGVYTDDGNGEPELLVGKTSATAKGTTAGWKTVSGLNISISSSTVYWLAVQLDDTATATLIDWNFQNGPGDATLTSQTVLPADWGSSTFKDADAKVAIYAVYGTSSVSETVTPSALSSTLTQQTPDINYDYALDVSTQALALTQQTPTLTYDYALDVTTQALTLTSPAPNLIIGPIIYPSALSLTLTLPTPTTEFDYNFDVATQSLTTSLKVPSVNYDWKESVAAQSLTVSLEDPSVDLGGSVSPSALALNLTIQAPAVGSMVLVSPSALELGLNLLTSVGGETGGYQALGLGWGHQDFRHSGKPQGISLFWKGHIADEKHHEPKLSEYSGISTNLAELAERVIPTRGQTGPNVNAPLTPKMPHIKRNKDNLLAMYLRGETLHNKTLFNRIGRRGAKVGDGVESATNLLHKWKEAQETKS